MDLPPVTAILATIGAHGPSIEAADPPGQAGPWRVWLRGQPEGWERLSPAHGFGAEGSLPPAQVLAALLDRVGIDRALAQLEGHWHALLVRGARLTAVSSRLGTGRWWVRVGEGSAQVADHPSALVARTDADPARLAAMLTGRALPPGATCWPDVARVEPGTRVEVGAAGPGPSHRWWDPGAPPDGRAGARGVWDRAVEQALVLGVARATRAGPWALAPGAPAGDAFVRRVAPTQPMAARATPGVEAVLAAAPRLAEPRLGGAARRVAGAILAAPAGPRLVVATGAALLLGGADPRRGRPAAWSHRLQIDLGAELLGPLCDLRPVAPALLHPAVAEVAARVPWRHLRGLRGTLAGRLGLVESGRDPWKGWLAGPGAAAVARAREALSAIGPVADHPADQARAVVMAAWLV